ncbi:ectoine/hydroxyectoine ABC transporter substrate-binding protein EhuB [Amycolatopsis palatopharyngis]|uniref:ectoine/hydroxyectoine ABC transporter substrate-binding protein EhuB n=1 Tax=Amycolatopsis palatopharyngis TaxID=187982 RepID=UPI000E22177E|nr:ectoine/hydroxyectoine ABC transporter substrate-binding protein EhuB [Amycolatopsis palatopharyngis]
MSDPKVNRLSRRALLRYSAIGIAAVGGGAVLSACQTTNPDTGQPESEGGLQQRVDSGQPIRLAIANEPPYTVLTAEGELTGAEPDVAKAVLERMGITNIEGVQTQYDSMIPGLTANRWDMVTAGMFMDQARCSQVLYASPVIVSTESFAVPAGNPKGLTTIDDVMNQDVQVAVLAGSFELRAAKSLGVPESKLPTYPAAPDALQGLADGRVDAVLLPTLSLEAEKEKGGNFEITAPLEDFPTTGSSAAFRQTDTEFQGKYNEELKAFKETPEFEAILEKWGFSADAARKATTEELCSVEAG